MKKLAFWSVVAGIGLAMILSVFYLIGQAVDSPAICSFFFGATLGVYAWILDSALTLGSLKILSRKFFFSVTILAAVATFITGPFVAYNVYSKTLVGWWILGVLSTVVVAGIFHNLPKRNTVSPNSDK